MRNTCTFVFTLFTPYFCGTVLCKSYWWMVWMDPKRSSVCHVQSHFNHFTSILSLPYSEAHFKLQQVVSTVSLSWCHVIGRFDVCVIEEFNILHHIVTSGCRLHVSLTHCIVLHLYKAPRPYCVSRLESLHCFSSQLPPTGIKGCRESGTAYIRPKTMESRMSGEWYVTSFSPREMEIFELCSFGCTAGDLALLLALALWFNSLSVKCRQN